MNAKNMHTFPSYSSIAPYSFIHIGRRTHLSLSLSRYCFIPECMRTKYWTPVESFSFFVRFIPFFSILFWLADGFVHTIRVLRFVSPLNRLDSINCRNEIEEGIKMKGKKKQNAQQRVHHRIYCYAIELYAIQRKQNRTSKKKIQYNMWTNLWQTDRKEIKKKQNRNEKNGPNIYIASFV